MLYTYIYSPITHTLQSVNKIFFASSFFLLLSVICIIQQAEFIISYKPLGDLICQNGVWNVCLLTDKRQCQFALKDFLLTHLLLCRLKVVKNEEWSVLKCLISNEWLTECIEVFHLTPFVIKYVNVWGVYCALLTLWDLRILQQSKKNVLGLLFEPEDEGTMIPWNIGNYCPAKWCHIPEDWNLS